MRNLPQWAKRFPRSGPRSDGGAKLKPDPDKEICLDDVISEDKLHPIPALADIVKKGRIVEERPAEDPKATSYITMETAVELDGKNLTVRFVILTAHDGGHAYCPMLSEPGPDGDGVNLWFVSQ